MSCSISPERLPRGDRYFQDIRQEILGLRRCEEEALASTSKEQLQFSPGGRKVSSKSEYKAKEDF